MANEKPFKLDMPFGEALRRFGRTEAKELPETVKLRKPDKPATRGEKKKAGQKKSLGPPER